ncbi:MAG TPA: D-glycero-beta-D-manno-heptose-7-phosphate kinase [Planctomycetes bacterium]|nr:D-glycero-beta-D-manno-heptose-7-phosphate kinase [Planctomycetota bacterium]
MDERHLLGVLEGLGTPRVLILGDLILDRYVSGEVQRISPEAPIPVLAARQDEVRLGGAGNVAANLRAMGAEVEILGVVGDDGKGRMLRELLEAIGVESSGVHIAADRPTTEKTRLIGGAQQILRVDWEESGAVGSADASSLLEGLDQRLEHTGAVILSDYGKGVLTDGILADVIARARAASVPVLVDPKGEDYSRYRGATLVTPNRREAEVAIGRTIEHLEDLPAVAERLMDQAELDAAVITLGADGIFYRERGRGSGDRVPTAARAVFDVTGAGDTVISHLALVLAAGRPLAEAVRLANHAAGLVVARRGAASVTREELAATLGAGSGAGAVLDPEDLPGVLALWRSEGKRIVFTNGCFDILHAGHVDYLRKASARGDVLLVGVNDDQSVARLKGPSRPINPIGDRLTVLAALEMVDAVVPFPEDTPERIIEEVTPDVLVKGEDWADKGVVGREWVESHGGEVYLAPLTPGRSTTAVVQRAQEAERTQS